LPEPDSRVLVGPGVGRDAAALSFGDRVLVVKSDPITFATAGAGSYLVHVNANDVACLGAEPRWLMVTALLPDGSSTPALVESLFNDLVRACTEIGVQLVGGHSEVTVGLDRPILIGCMLGETDGQSLYDLRRAQPGDPVLLCNAIAIEGTSILATEASPERLTGIPPLLLERARRFLLDPGISVLPAARALREAGVNVRGLHDPTEGGLATALHELAEATGLGIVVNRDEVPILKETEALCTALGLDPLGLIASGALLAVIDPNDLALTHLRRHEVEAAIVGELVEDRSTRVLRGRDGTHPLPQFPVDEIARYFSTPTSESSV
jgi:hydrogenase maturation factor